MEFLGHKQIYPITLKLLCKKTNNTTPLDILLLIQATSVVLEASCDLWTIGSDENGLVTSKNLDTNF